MSDPTALPAWHALQRHYQQICTTPLKTLFAQDSQRFEKFSLSAVDILLDYSKNPLVAKTMELLLDLAYACEVPQKLQDLFSGKIVNQSEQRPALHHVLRRRNSMPPEVANELTRMRNVVQHIHQSSITDIVNIGIGGSDLGPAMVSAALRDYAVSAQRLHFVSTLDAQQITEILKSLHPDTTLFIISSKSFTTQETLVNANIAKQWLGKRDFNHHAIAVTANTAAANAFGFISENIYSIWPWVGGRYSVWSAIGLPIAIQIGMDNFLQFLQGAAAIDEHVSTAPFGQNMPVIMALLSIWLINFFGYTSRAILPYDVRLARLPAYLQQLEMESTGKRVRQDGTPVNYQTGVVIWGEPGTNGQHAFHQLLYQGTQIIPLDFIITKTPQHTFLEQHRLLIAHCLAQSRAFMLGTEGKTPHQAIPGNCPSNMLVLPTLSPFSLGTLLALYEYKVFVSAAIWDINAFDQWGVELGKQMAEQLSLTLRQDKIDETVDSSTQGLMRYLLQHP